MAQVELITPHGPSLKRFDEWLTPAFPDWFKSLPSTRYQYDYDRDSFTNAKSCPSFVRLFKNSYLLRAPEDVMMTSPEKGSRVLFASAAGTTPGFQTVTSADMNAMMHPSFAETHINLQFTFQFAFIAETPMEMVYLDPCYHLEKKSELTAMTGTVQLHPELYMPVSVNMLLPLSAFDCKSEAFIKKGQPLAYLFFPGGRPKIETRKISMDDWHMEHGYQRTTFQGHWIREMNELETA